jgi:gentisate 1,2-dioxygenase
VICYTSARPETAGTPRHTTEAYLYCVKGHGFTVVNYEGEPEKVIEWSEGMLFAPPRWAWHQHFNADTTDTSRYLAIQDTGLLRTMRLHQIGRHPVQLTSEQAAAPHRTLVRYDRACQG